MSASSALAAAVVLRLQPLLASRRPPAPALSLGPDAGHDRLAASVTVRLRGADRSDARALAAAAAAALEGADALGSRLRVLYRDAVAGPGGSWLALMRIGLAQPRRAATALPRAA